MTAATEEPEVEEEVTEEEPEVEESNAADTVFARAKKNGISARIDTYFGGFAFDTASGQLFLGRVDGVQGAHDWLFGFEGACVAMLEDRLNSDKSNRSTCSCQHGTILDRVRRFLGMKEKK